MSDAAAMPSPTLPSLRRSCSSLPFVPVSTLHLPRYYVEAILEEFGSDRSMFASNLPVEKLRCVPRDQDGPQHPQDLWTDYKLILDAIGLDDEAQRGMLGDNAARGYRL